MDYVKADGDISNYYPDFPVKLSDERIFVFETKWQADVNVPLKLQRLQQWCADINGVVDQESFDRFKPATSGIDRRVQITKRTGAYLRYRMYRL